MKIDLKKSGGDFSSVNTFPPKQTILLLDLSVLIDKAKKVIELCELGEIIHFGY